MDFVDLTKEREERKSCCKCMFPKQKYISENDEIIQENIAQILEKVYNEMISYNIPHERAFAKVQGYVKDLCKCECHKFELEEKN